ncbi:MAG: hypothetical protein R3208_22520, partial [Ketobacteraceae bacterium]|nr:hypothetical protein [Ketobacteraceae bacterium]
SIEERFLTEADVARAVTDICRSSGVSLRQFVLTPDPDKDGWKLLVEGFNGDLQQFANQLAAQLKTFFSADRALTVAEVADSALTEYVRSKQKGNGLPNAQYKPLHLSTNPQLCHGFKITRTVVAMSRGEANGADTARQSATEAMI